MENAPDAPNAQCTPYAPGTRKSTRENFGPFDYATFDCLLNYTDVQTEKISATTVVDYYNILHPVNLSVDWDKIVYESIVQCSIFPLARSPWQYVFNCMYMYSTGYLVRQLGFYSYRSDLQV